MQLRALVRAAAHGALKIMLPMVTVPAELEAARALLAEAAAAVGRPAPPLGIMVEVPAAALAIGRFDAAFFSIGSNDLVQYVTASARDIAAVAPLADLRNPAVLRLIAEVAAHGARTGREVSLCGDAAGDPALLPLLLDAGIDRLSMAPNAVGAVKAAIAAHGVNGGNSMKKFLNSPETILADALDGFAAAHAGLVALGPERQFVRRVAFMPGKVGLLSGGGSGHEPLHAGFVGRGMLDAACPGQVFTAPTPDQMLAAAQAIDTGAGVLFIVKNYEGDVMNFDMAREMFGGRVETVLTDDDVAVETSTWSLGRRGVAGTLVVEKIVGAAAEQGRDLAALAALGARVNKATRSMGVALTSCTVPAAGRPTFAIGEDEIEIGVGLHGEPGRRREKLRPADALAEEMIAAIMSDLGAAASGEVLLLVNGFGATPLMELYVMFHAARARTGAARRARGAFAGRQLCHLP